MAPLMQGVKEWLDKFFRITDRGSSVGTELRAGISSFLTMSYILLVNPNILASAGLPVAQVATSTALTSCIASLLVGVFANLPVGIAPGMGLNAYLVFSQVLGMGTSVNVALACCMTASIAVAILAVIHALTLILHLVPHSIKLAVVVGMGLLLSFIGLQKAGVVVKDEQTMVGLGDLRSAEVLLAMAGLTAISSLHYKNVKGSILIGVVFTALGYFSIKGGWPTAIVAPPEMATWKLDFTPILAGDPNCISAVVAYALVMIFDIGGALYGLCGLAGLIHNGVAPGAIATYLSAAVGTALGAWTGTTPLIIAAESAVGIKEGGRTGLVAVTVSFCFGASLFLSPILQAVPAVATAPVLVLVGAMMMGEAGHINWTSMPTAVPAFLTMVIQPFTFSIANGIYAGLLFSLAMFITTGDFIPWFRSLLQPSAEEQAAAMAGTASEPFLLPGDGEAPAPHPLAYSPTAAAPHYPATAPSPFGAQAAGSPHTHIFKRASLTTSQATNIVMSVSRNLMHNMATSPVYTSTTHSLLINQGQHMYPPVHGSPYATSPHGPQWQHPDSSASSHQPVLGGGQNREGSTHGASHFGRASYRGG